MGGSPSKLRRLLIPALVVAMLLVATVVATVLVWAGERDEAELANEAIARQAAAIAEREVELTASSLPGGEGLLRRSGPMPEDGFRRYARDILTDTEFPGLGWAPRVPARERARFERSLGREIVVPITPTQQQPRAILRRAPRREGAYYPVRFVHPDERGPRRALGLDLLSEPTRAAAVREARDSGVSALTSPVLRAGRASTSVVIVDPIYSPGARVRNLPQRRRAIAGVISGALPTAAIAAEIHEQLGEAVDVSIRDGDQVVVAAEDPEAEGESMEVDVLGRTWDVHTAEVAEPAVLPALAVGGFGLLLAALAAALFALAGRREQVLSRERDVATDEAEAQRATATALQQAFLPPSLPSVPGIETAAVYAPGAEGLEVGGDFYDLFETGNHWTAMIGDVSGKGARAAALTSLVRYTARGLADRGPVQVTQEMNEAIRRETAPGTFATVCVASLRRLDDGIDVAMVVAGHPPPLLAHADGSITPVQPTAPLVGVLDRIDVAEARLRIAPGEALLLYTDGLIEARRRGAEPFGEDRLCDAFAEVRDLSPREILRELMARAADYAPDFPQDDVAILVLRAR